MRRKHRPGCLIFLCLFLVLTAYVSAELYFSNNVLSLEPLTLYSEKLPGSFDGFTIVHLSDLHEKNFGKDGRALYDMVRGAAPDIIAVTGDFVHSPESLDYFRDTCETLSAIAPVYYVTGNHEWSVEWSENRAGQPSFIARLRTVMEETGVTYMDSAVLPLQRGEQSIALTGICDPNGPDYAPDAKDMYDEMLLQYGETAYSIALYHRSDILDCFPDAAFDLVLTGHIHGGVVRLPFVGGLVGPDRELFPPYTDGLYTKGSTTMAVSRGIGDTYVPRFGNRPQISLITLKTGEP